MAYSVEEKKELETKAPALVLKEPFKCKLGWHEWGVWSEPEITPFGSWTGTTRQVRYCRGCNKLQVRSARSC